MSRILTTTFLCALVALAACSEAQDTGVPRPAATERTQLQDSLGVMEESATTRQDQVDVAVTVYNNNLALVRDRRDVSLRVGEQSLRFMDVASEIRPQTVSLQSLSDPGSIVVLEQNYEYDLISPEKLMEKFIGKEVALVNFSNEVGFTRKRATLMSNNNQAVYEIDGEIFLDHPGNVVLPEIPQNLIAKPTLVWLLNNESSRQQLEATYLTGGISWEADYVLTLNAETTTMDVDGWVTLNNRSGADYENAQLKLVAGEVNRVREDRMMVAKAEAYGMAGGRTAFPMPQQEAFAEYHLYTMPRRTTIKQNQSKQLNLLKASGASVTKAYEVRGREHYFLSRIPPEKQEEKVGVFLEFTNSEKNNLGMPLPGGVMRIYQEDSTGMLQFAGEDRVEHTPKDEEIRLHLGNAFDIAVDRTQTDFRRVDQNTHESAFRIELRNRKEEDVTVDIIEPMTGDWRVIEHSHDFEKRDAFTLVFTVPLPADAEIAVTYRIQTRAG